jgi:hypothetical protein
VDLRWQHSRAAHPRARRRSRDRAFHQRPSAADEVHWHGVRVQIVVSPARDVGGAGRLRSVWRVWTMPPISSAWPTSSRWCACRRNDGHTIQPVLEDRRQRFPPPSSRQGTIQNAAPGGQIVTSTSCPTGPGYTGNARK